MPKKTDAQLAYDEKLDLARVLVRFKHRRLAARELNDLEDAIKRAHDSEVASGTITQIDFDSLGVGSLAKEVEGGNQTLQLASGDADEKVA